MADARAFLERWSRLKRKTRAEPRSAAMPRQPAIAESPAREPAAPASAPAAPASAPELPPLETLGKDSDYTPFMRADVPDAIRNEALQRLWRSDPVFANLDGLLEYGEDFGAAFKAGTVVATVYRVLEGMPGLAPREPAEEDAAASPAAGSGTASAAREPPTPEQPAAAKAAPATADGRSDEVGLE